MSSQPSPGRDRSLDDLDVAGTLAAAGMAVDERHFAEVFALEVDLHFAVLHSEDPRGGRPRMSLAEAAKQGLTRAQWEAAGNRLVQLGGEGTPMVQDLPICELAVARRLGLMATRNHLADALDLESRFPLYWAALRAGQGQVWLARKIAALSRHLDRDQVKTVDTAVAAALEESPGRVLRIAEAATLRADPDHARQEAEARLRRRCVVVGRPGEEDGLTKIFSLADQGDATWFDTIIDRLADLLAERPDLTGLDPETTSRDELRAEALAWLAHPDDAAALLAGTYQPPDQPTETSHVTEATDITVQDARTEDAEETGGDTRDGGPDAPPAPSPAPPPAPSPAPTPPAGPAPGAHRSAASRQRAVLHVHVSQAAVAALLARTSTGAAGAAGVARVEELGPILLRQITRLLGHARVDLKPVIDLNQTRSVNGYEHPPDIAERAFLRTTGDVFPHASSQSRRLDHDHVIPYDDTGPPGQTGDHNLAPLSRRHHRAKTHQSYQVHQIGLGRYLWRTPHGLHRLVDGTGTHVIDAKTAKALTRGSTD